MNFGTQQIQDIIYTQAKRAGLRGYPLGKFAKDTAKMIGDMLGEIELRDKTEAPQAYPQHIETLVRRLEKGLKFNLFPRTTEAREIYEWVLDQEKQGYPLDRFISWALQPDRLKYAGKYRSKPMYIKADWPQAFIGSPADKTIVRNEDGSLYV